MVDTLDTTFPIARKTHRCNYCELLIPKGSKYEYSKNVMDGDHYVWKAHLGCSALVHYLRMDYNPCGEGVDHEYFQSCVMEDHRKEGGNLPESQWPEILIDCLERMRIATPAIFTDLVVQVPCRQMPGVSVGDDACRTCLFNAGENTKDTIRCMLRPGRKQRKTL